MTGKQDKLSIEYVGSLFGHNDVVSALTVGKDKEGKPLLVSGSRDRKIIVWKLELDKPKQIPESEGTGKDEVIVGTPFKSLSGHSHFVSGLSLNKESNYLVSSSWDKTIRLWDLNTFKTKSLIVGHTKDVLCVTFANNDRDILSGSMDKTFRDFNIKGEEKFNVGGFNGWVSSITTIEQEKEKLYAVSSWDNSVKILDKDFKVVHELRDFDYGVVSTSTDDEGEFLFSAEKNGKIRVHSISKEDLKQEKVPNKSTIEVNADINAISFENKYFFAISIATSKGLIVQEVSKTNRTLFRQEPIACHSLAWDESKTYLFAGFADGAVRVYRFNNN